jgi:hypothetical protein
MATGTSLPSPSALCNAPFILTVSSSREPDLFRPFVMTTLRPRGDWLHDLSKYFGKLILVQRFMNLPSTPFGIGRFALEQNGLAWLHSRGDKVSPRS